ncbi:cyclin-dependent kinase G-2 isoform X1 [Senna tora]|uniref:Cyclin-dependent kinase G-2 isoform X1 n=1 Tax=Senna tora TaxID=362788 RepID=A0A834SPN3_9FABA|nr:cyclin-dependent kinase G-2 isoform X1 [Senna tora]
MAVGRQGAYNDNKYRDREFNFDVSRWALSNSKEDYDQIRTGNRDVVRARNTNARDRIRVRQKDVRKEKPLMAITIHLRVGVTRGTVTHRFVNIAKQHYRSTGESGHPEKAASMGEVVSNARPTTGLNGVLRSSGRSPSWNCVISSTSELMRMRVAYIELDNDRVPAYSLILQNWHTITTGP